MTGAGAGAGAGIFIIILFFLENVGNLCFPLFAIFRPPDHAHQKNWENWWCERKVSSKSERFSIFGSSRVFFLFSFHPDGRLHVFFLDKRTNGQAPYGQADRTDGLLPETDEWKKREEKHMEPGHLYGI